MNVIRLLILLVVAWLLWRAWRLLRAQLTAQPPPEEPTPPPEATSSYEPMARCSRCGVHAPAHALSKAGLCGRCAE